MLDRNATIFIQEKAYEIVQGLTVLMNYFLSLMTIEIFR